LNNRFTRTRDELLAASLESCLLTTELKYQPLREDRVSEKLHLDERTEMITVKRLLIVVVVFLSVSLSAQNSDTLEILFVGNSYTYYNDLPLLFENLAVSGGKPVLVDNSSFGSYRLATHCLDVTTRGKINSRSWDYVVLQEQSQYPVIDYWRYNSMYPSARFLDSLITLQGSHTAFYMTWGRKYGGQQTSGGYSSPVFTDFFHMQDSLRSAYVGIANELAALVAPVGMAWGLARTLNPAVDLWQSDNSHPTLKGSYLAACVFYAVFFNESPVGLDYTGGLTASEATFFQNVANQTVTTIENEYDKIPSTSHLDQNYPNPFNPDTHIRFELKKTMRVSLFIYNTEGERIATLIDNEQVAAGAQELEWHAAGVASGVYFSRLLTDDGHSYSRKMVLLK
jgi:hypothetical protein